MKIVKIFSFLFVVFITMGCVTAPNMQNVRMTSNVSSQILNLKNSRQGNTNTVIADRAMRNGFLSMGEEYGYYTINLTSRGIGIGANPMVYMYIPVPNLIFPLLGAQIERWDFDLTIELIIYDSNMSTIRSYSDSARIRKYSGLYYSGDATNEASNVFSKMLVNIQRIASAESTSINNALREAGPIIRQSSAQQQHPDITTATENGAKDVMAQLQQRGFSNARIAIINISSPDSEQSMFVAGELEHLFVQNRFNLVDRSELDRIRREQNFQLSGDVDDDQIVSIGKFAGANLVVTGSITGSGSTRRLRLRVLDTQTADIRATASEPF